MTLAQENSLDASSGVVVRTPPAETRPSIDYTHIPWIHFLNITESYSRSRAFRDEPINAHVRQSKASVHCLRRVVTASRPRSRKGADLCLGFQAEAPRDLAMQLHDKQSAWTGIQHGSDLTSVSQNDTQMEVASMQHAMFDNSINLHSDLHSNLQDNFDSFCTSLDNFTHLSSLSPFEAGSSMTMVEASIQALSFLADFAGPITENTLQGFEKQVRTYQEDLAIGMRDLDSRTVKPGSFGSLLRLMGFLVYLSSNNLVADQWLEIDILGALDMLVRWLHDSRTEWVLWQLLDLKTSTTEVFGAMVFRRAAKLGLIEMVRNLIDKRVDVNTLDGDSSTRETALKLAVTHNQIDIVRLLLQRGADPRHGEQRYTRSILCCALDGPDRIDMVQLLIDHGAEVNDKSDHEESSVLRDAIQKRYHAIARLLLKAGAHVMDIDSISRPEPLNLAVGNNDIEMVQILIDAGEDINGRARRFIMGDQFSRIARHHPEILAAPIQLASLANNTELVQMLLDEGADPCRDVRRDTYQDHAVEYTYVPAALQSAVRHGNAVTVRMLLKAHADVNDRTGHLGPPLAIAAANADLKIVRILLRHGSHINAPAENFRESATALQAAAKTGDLEVVKELLDNGADVNADAGPIIGRTALQAAAEEGNLELVKFLISTRADLNADPGLEMGVTCLQAAVGQGHVDLALFLLDNGAFVNGPPAARSGGVTALRAALKLFTRDSDRNEADQAKDLSRFALLKTLLNEGAYLNSPCSPGRSLSTLTIAVLSGRPDLIQFLLESGLNPNPCVSYRSPLGEAVAQTDINIVRCLINAGTDVDAWYEVESHHDGGPDLFAGLFLLDDFKGTPLHVAAFKGKVEIAGLLLDAGAEIGVIHFHDRLPSYSALQWAVEGSCAQMVKYLLDRGADPDVYTATAILSPHTPWRKLYSPLEQAITRLFEGPEYLEVIAALLNAGADANPTPGHRFDLRLRVGFMSSFFQRVALEPNAGPEVIQLLLERGASVNWTSDGNTALQSIAELNRNDMVELLLNAGANVNAPAVPLRGRTALQHATENGNLEMVKLLLARGADVNAPAADDGGVTALQGSMCKGSLKMVLTLLEAGANINDAPAAVDGRTALEAAAEFGRLDIVHLLLNNDKEPDTIEARCKRAAEFAEEEHHSTIARDLRQHRPKQ